MDTSGAFYRMFVLFVAVSLVSGLLSHATPVLAETSPSDALIKELLQKLEERDRKLSERDKIISDLVRRVEDLERSNATDQRRESAPDSEKIAALQPAAHEPTPQTVEPARVDTVPSTQQVPRTSAPQPEQTAGSETSQSQRQETETESGQRKQQQQQGAPGAFEVDEDAAERALERTLVEVGALLLPFGRAEITPSIQYSRDEDDLNARRFFGADAVLAKQEPRTDTVVAAAGLRVGLPWDSQFEFRMPFEYKRTKTRERAGFGIQSNLTRSSSTEGLGDLRVGVAKTLVREKGWIPDLVGRVAWDTKTGRSDKRLQLGSGFNELSASLSALKRQDPLAFSAAFSYEKSLKNDDITPGDEFGFSAGVALAASPETSLQFSYQQTIAGEAKVNGSKLRGSDQNAAVVSIGASSILGRGALLTATAGIGLTDDSPDYIFRVALPIRFNTPFLE